MTEREQRLLERIGELEQERDDIRQRMHIQIRRLVIERDFLRAQTPGQWGEHKDTCGRLAPKLMGFAMNSNPVRKE